MKKLKLELEDLIVTSFTPGTEDASPGTVHGMQISQYYFGSGCQHCDPSFVETQCFVCTQEEGCYPSMYCSDIGPGMPNNSCDPGCMTDNYANC